MSAVSFFAAIGLFGLKTLPLALYVLLELAWPHQNLSYMYASIGWP
jgi:hypothetical protein